VGNADVVGHLHRLIAFDLDGTLIDSRRDLADSANQLIEELGGQILTEEQIGGMVGEGAALLVRRALQASGRGERAHALERFLEIYDERLLNHTRVYDGVEEVVRQARGRARLTVLTNKPTTPTERILAGLGLRDAFDEVIGGDGPYRRKPDPAGLKAMMKARTPRLRTRCSSAIQPLTSKPPGGAEASCCLVSYGFGFRRELHEQQGPGVRIAATATELSRAIDDVRFVVERGL
jgi:phosphoglycolate phosphatase